VEKDRSPDQVRVLRPFLITFFLVAFPWTISLPQVSPSQAYNQGNRFFQEGQYKKAVGSYQKALNAGVRNSFLLYNLGNAYYKDGQLGRAIWAYEEAKVLSPRDGDITYNLKLLCSLLGDKSAEASAGGMIGFFSRLPGYFTLWELSWGESILYLLLTFSIVGFLLSFKPGPRRAMRRLITTLAFLFFVSLLLFASRTYQLNFKQRAVILATQLEARSGPGEEYTKIITLHEGMEVEIKENRQGWCLVKLPNGLGGWIEKDSLLRI